MASCEKCWNDADTRCLYCPGESKYKHYCDLIDERKDSPCTPEEQAGQFWDKDMQCDRRLSDTSGPGQ